MSYSALRPSVRPPTSRIQTSYRLSTSRACASAIRSRSRCRSSGPALSSRACLHSSAPRRGSSPPVRRHESWPTVRSAPGRSSSCHSLPANGPCSTPITTTGRAASLRRPVGRRLELQRQHRAGQRAAVGGDQRAHSTPLFAGATISRLVDDQGPECPRLQWQPCVHARRLRSVCRPAGPPGAEAGRRP